MAVSLLLTYHAIISAILGAINIRKNGQLGFLDSVILGLSYSLQLLAHLFVVVTIGLLALPRTDNPAADGTEDASLSCTHAALLLFLPVVFRWISIDILFCYIVKNEIPMILLCLPKRFLWTTKGKRFTNLRRRLLHVLSNTWVTVPVRDSKNKKQVHKGTEIRWSLILAGFNILATWAMTATLMTNKNPLNNSVHIEFFFVGALASHLAGCCLLLLFYKYRHPWRELIVWQKMEVTRMGINEETPFWEVSKWNKDPKTFLCVQDKGEVARLLLKDSEGQEVGILGIQILLSRIQLREMGAGEGMSLQKGIRSPRMDKRIQVS